MNDRLDQTDRRTPSAASVGQAFLGELRARLPDLPLLSERADTASFRYDETEYTYPGWPLAVAMPRTTQEVVTIVGLAARHRVPIVPRGAGSGLSGGATAVEGALTLVTTKMDRIRRSTPPTWCLVQPGHVDLGAAAEHGLFTPRSGELRPAPSAATWPRTHGCA
jgi:glycolate oxidase